MALDIFFPEDIERICDALEQASLYHDQDIRIGWLAAMSAVRAAFGLPQKTLTISSSVSIQPPDAWPKFDDWRK